MWVKMLKRRCIFYFNGCLCRLMLVVCSVVLKSLNPYGRCVGNNNYNANYDNGGEYQVNEPNGKCTLLGQLRQV